MGRRLIIFVSMLVVLGLVALPAAAQSGAVWTGEYYNNAVLQGTPTIVRQEGAVAFDWGAGSPGTGIPADNFSVRWGSDPFFQSGTYRFWVLADDKVRVTVDFSLTPLIDTFNSNQVGQIIAADVTLSQGNHHIQIDYQEAGGNAFVYVTWANLATNPSGPNFPIPGAIAPSGTSWTAQYYANGSLSGSPTLIQSENSPSHDWGSGSPVASIPVDNFSARWTSVQTLEAATYQISVRADDGVKVTVNGVTYINEFHSATGLTYTANVTLNAGQHSFLIEYYEGNGLAFLDYRFGKISPVGTPIPVNTPILTGATATVTGAFRLNVRNQPSAINTTVLTRINRNETYAIVGRTARTTWYQINVNGTIGWVNARYVTASNAANVPVTDGSVIVPTATPTVIGTCGSAPPPRLIAGRVGRVTPGLPNNIRAQPSSSSTRLGQIPSGGLFAIVSGPTCAEGFNWWQVTYNGITGWTPEGANGQYFLELAS